MTEGESKVTPTTADEALYAYGLRETHTALSNYFMTSGADEKGVGGLLDSLEKSLILPRQKGIKIPQRLRTNAEPVRNYLLKELNSLRAVHPVGPEVTDFILKQYDLIKYAQEERFLANAGVQLEVLKIPIDCPPELLSWLKEEFDVSVGDTVIHRHVIDVNAQSKLQKAGVPVPHVHWDRSYFADATHQAAELLQLNPQIKGVISLGSWIYDPNNHVLATDGKPYAAFGFLQEEQLVGHRVDLGEATLSNDFRSQYRYATRNQRRATLANTGEYQPHVYGVFYPREELLQADVMGKVA